MRNVKQISVLFLVLSACFAQASQFADQAYIKNAYLSRYKELRQRTNFNELRDTRHNYELTSLTRDLYQEAFKQEIVISSWKILSPDAQENVQKAFQEKLIEMQQYTQLQRNSFHYTMIDILGCNFGVTRPELMGDIDEQELLLEHQKNCLGNILNYVRYAAVDIKDKKYMVAYVLDMFALKMVMPENGEGAKWKAWYIQDFMHEVCPEENSLYHFENIDQLNAVKQFVCQQQQLLRHSMKPLFFDAIPSWLRTDSLTPTAGAAHVIEVYEIPTLQDHLQPQTRLQRLRKTFKKYCCCA